MTTRSCARPLAFALVLCAAASAQPALAKRSPVNEWFCASLTRQPFDPRAAIAAFPLERLPEPVETRRLDDDDKDDPVTHVEMEAEGESYTVRYDYAYKNADVTDPYGFNLEVYVSYPESERIEPEMAKWLKEMGKPADSFMGKAVYAGPPIYEGGEAVFNFQTWKGSAVYSANWWSRGDIRYAADLCK